MALTPKKKKDLITLGILGIIIVALIVAVVLISGWQKDKEDDSDSEDKTGISLWSYDVSEIAKASVKVGEDDTMVVFVNGTDEAGASVYAVEGDLEFPLDQTKAENLFGLSALTFSEKFFDSHDDLTQFGLAEPEITAGIETTGGKSHTIYVGDKVPGKSMYYAMVEGDTAIYAISNSSRNNMNYTSANLVKGETPPTITLDTIRRVLVASKEFGDFELFYDADPEQSITGMIVNLWFMGAPFKTIREANSDSVQTFLGNYTSYTVSDVVDYRKENLPKYGLGEKEGDILFISYVTGTTDANGETVYLDNYYALYIGNKTEDGENYYVRQNDSNIVYLMSASDVEKLLDVDAKSLISMYVNMIYISTVSKMTVTHGSDKHIYEFTYKTELDDEGNEKQVNSEYIIDGKKLSVDNSEDSEAITAFKKVYQAIIGARGERVIEEDLEYKAEDVIFSVRYERTSDDYKEVLIEYLPYSESYYTVRINGEFMYFVDRRDIDAMIETVTNYVP